MPEESNRPSLTILGGPMGGKALVLEEDVDNILIGSDPSRRFQPPLPGGEVTVPDDDAPGGFEGGAPAAVESSPEPVESAPEEAPADFDVAATQEAPAVFEETVAARPEAESERPAFEATQAISESEATFIMADANETPAFQPSEEFEAPPRFEVELPSAPLPPVSPLFEDQTNLEPPTTTTP